MPDMALFAAPTTVVAFVEVKTSWAYSTADFDMLFTDPTYQNGGIFGQHISSATASALIAKQVRSY